MNPIPNLEVIFSQALRLPPGDARRQFLEQACAGEPDLLQRVLTLLTAAEEAGSFLQQPLMPKPEIVSPTPRGNAMSGSVEFPFLGPPSEPGDLGTIGPYRVLQRVGRGGMGLVFRAFDPKLQRIVALKVMAPELAADPTARKRFEREARSAAAVSHPHVVVIHAVDETHRPPYLVMEFVSGKTLADKIKTDGMLAVKEILRIGAQTAEGLAAAHKQGLIHRDIKPANILLENGVERVKVTDFGLARAADDLGMTRTGDLSGTPQFMSPEQARGELVDHRSDLFSLGAVLYTLCTGHPPFRAGNPLAAMKRICDDTPRPISESNPEIPEWLCQIVVRLLDKSPDKRFQTAAEVASVLNSRLASIQRGRSKSKLPEEAPETSLRAVRPRTKKQALTGRRWSTKVLIGIVSASVVVLTIGLGTMTFFKPSKDHGNSEITPVPPAKDLALGPTSPKAATPNTSIANSIADVKQHKSPVNWHGWAADAPPPAIAPFSSEQARQHQTAWAKYLDVPVEFTNSIGMKFHLIPPGEFLMGAPQADIDAGVKAGGDNPQWVDCAKGAGPQHRAIITRPFYLGDHEVTQGQFLEVMNQSYAAFGPTNPKVAGMDIRRHPIEQVVCPEAVEFCEKLTSVERQSSKLPKDVFYTLPTEAEWEFACRAGTTTRYWSGDTDADLMKVGWVEGTSGKRTHVVGELPANPFGLHDMHGNVAEWTRDWVDFAFYQRFVDHPAVDQHRGITDFRSARGGAWENPIHFCHSAARFNYFPPHPLNWVGFRAMLTIASPKMPPRTSRPPMNAADFVTKLDWKGWPQGGPDPARTPFSTVQARQLQQSWATHLNIPVEFKNSVGMEFQLIPPAEYDMGTSMREFQNEVPFVSLHNRDRRLSYERPKHRVILSQPFYLGRHEVTQRDFQKVMGRNPSHFSKEGMGHDLVGKEETASFPVESMLPNDATEFCQKLSELEMLSPQYEMIEGAYKRVAGTGYRLPTEAEWEFACRAGTTTRFWISDRDSDLIDVGWHMKNSQSRPHPVGQLKANAFGLFDLHGNVSELCDDGLMAYIYHQSETENIKIVDPLAGAPLGRQRVIRGGSFANEAELLRSAARNAMPFDKADSSIGFRVAFPVTAISMINSK